MKKKKTVILSVTACTVAVGLALGLGLGLGLKKKPAEEPQPAPTPSVSQPDPTPSVPVEPVTNTEWEEAFDFTDKNCTVTVAWDMQNHSEQNGEIVCYFLGDGSAYLRMNGEIQGGPGGAEILSYDLNEGYTFYARQAKECFVYDETSQSYKSTESWYAYVNIKNGYIVEEGDEIEDPMQLEGEVKFKDKLLTTCIVSLFGSDKAQRAGERGTYTVTVTDYGTTVKPSDAD